MDDLAALILAAGKGTRLRPLTWIRPKALCPVGGVPLVDHALSMVARHTSAVAVNVHHKREQMEAHLHGRAHLSIEEPVPLGTAGAVGGLVEWIAGRDLLIVNADRYHMDPLDGLLDGWRRDDVRLLVFEEPGRGDFGDMRFAGASLMPWEIVRTLAAEPSGLRDRCWEPMRARGRLALIPSVHPFVDCGTLLEYHGANMAASGGHSSIAPGARVDGHIERCVIWPDAQVRAGESLVDAIRATDDLTVFVH